MKTENEMNSSGSKNPAATNGTRKQNFRHKNYRYKAQPKKDGQKVTGQERPVKNTSYKPQASQSGEAFLKETARNNIGSKLKIIPLGGLEQIGMNITAFEYEDSIVVSGLRTCIPGR